MKPIAVLAQTFHMGAKYLRSNWPMGKYYHMAMRGRVYEYKGIGEPMPLVAFIATDEYDLQGREISEIRLVGDVPADLIEMAHTRMR